MTQQVLESKIKKIKPVLSEKYFVDRIGYFGSYTRNEQKKDSDIDIIVEFRKPLGWAFFELQEFLEQELNQKVDLVSIKALKEQLQDIILRQVKFV